MKAALLRTGSVQVHHLNRIPSGSPKFREGKTPTNGAVSSPRILFRSNSDTDVIGSGLSSCVSRVGSVSFPDMSVIVEEKEFDFGRTGNGNRRGNNNNNNNNNNNRGGGKSGNNNNEKSKIGEYYQQMLKSNPGDSLLLRNYGKYLHEVEKNAEKAEEYYGRAILASPGDGELLSLYGNLIWETQKDEDRAQSYFDQAVHASPHNCMVLGSYAHFLWEAEEDEEDGEEIKQGNAVAPAMVRAY